MENSKEKTYKAAIIISLILFGITGIWAINKQSFFSGVQKELSDELSLYRDSLELIQQVRKANSFLLKGDKDSAMAIYARFDTIEWVQEISKERIAILDSFKNNKVVIREVISTNNERETFTKSALPPETEVLISELNKEIEVTKSARDSMAANAIRERSELLQRMAEMEKSSEWKYLKFYKKTKGMYVNYVGQLNNGVAEGNGIGIYASGSVYRGQWKNGLRHGEGIFEWADGEKYEGEYQNDMRHGYGTYYWNNGLKYEGYWKDDKREGTGTLYDKKSKIIAEGTWKNDKVVK